MLVENRPVSAITSNRITDAMREAILKGELKPGSRLRQETLAAAYNSSRIPVREALRQLESEGLITLVPNSGAWVSKLDQAECVEIYKIREQLEPLALQESCPHLSDETLDQLEVLAQDIEAAQDIDDFLRLDREFHLLSYEGSKMVNLIQMIHQFWNTTQQYRRAYALSVEIKNLTPVYHEHWLMVDALKRRDGKHASILLRSHIRRTRLQLMQRSDLFE
ncbi:GntR family transcriptional regulator [Falsochrobactrum sp. TDYN1]|uniref:GntR family transcriptional regulator n=1 Tax=Falsochrobactrum tianjinense TaxID=2706015 RepID=A0A949PNV1_9HYPH|nr:GntR family transcriptional regulator [Falsochrobactrum sp. TDYN1]MBV2143484.1 GntR family transcriptional regulator [Falsochrobactrum sp. TDYN1]